MRTTIWVVGALLSLPGQGLESCDCLQQLAHLCADALQTAQCNSPGHPHLSASHGKDACPCQCRHSAPRQATPTPREIRPADDVDQAVRLAACHWQPGHDWRSPPLSSLTESPPRSVPALALCATLSRFRL
ncbi:hypothetical protein [Blastopirellula retiformator]|uniref:hypothetical protein n=1 Tax=Blastopirellula retiformator TaxID=2527970 RepID=UPI0011B3C88D|nr:hypothetical protein [Blastopirellula retiformator]